MGEGTNSWIKVDPAVLRWAEMRESVPKYFRFTRATVWTGIACLVIFPVTCQLMTIWSTVSTLVPWVTGKESGGDSKTHVPRRLDHTSAGGI